MGGWVGGEEQEAARSRMGRPLGAGTMLKEVGESPTGGRAFHGKREARERMISLLLARGRALRPLLCRACARHSCVPR